MSLNGKEDDELGYVWRDKEFAYYIKVSFIDNNGKMQSIGEELEAYRKMFELK